MNLAVLREADQVFVECALTGVSRGETGVGDGFGEEDHRAGVPVSAVLPGVPAAAGTRDLGPRQRSRPPAGCFPLCSALFDPPGPLSWGRPMELCTTAMPSPFEPGTQ